MVFDQISPKITRREFFIFITFPDTYMYTCTYVVLLLFSSYFLERSNSAKMTLSRARELFPIEVNNSIY